MTNLDFIEVGTFDTQGISDLPGEITYPTLKIQFEGSFSLSNWIPAGRIYRLADVGDEKPSIVGSRTVFLQQPNLITWDGLDLTYSLKFEPSPFLRATPLTMKIWGSVATPPQSSGGSGSIDPEMIRDIVGAMFLDSTSIAFTYNDPANLIQLDALFGSDAGTVCEGNDERLADSRDPKPGSVNNSSIANNAAIAWSKISKSGAEPSDVGAAAINHTHQASAIIELIEAIGDAIASIIQVGPNMTKSYDDAAGTLLLDADTGTSGNQTWEDLIFNSTAWEAAIT